MICQHKLLITITIILLTVSILGCASPSQSPSLSPTPTKAPVASDMPTPTPVPASNPFDTGKELLIMYQVFHYDDGVMTAEYSDIYNYNAVTLADGRPGYKLAIASTKKGTSFVDCIEVFLDTAHKPINGTLMKAENGVEVNKRALTTEEIMSYDLLKNDLSKIVNTTLSENVTVFAGQFASSKYIGMDDSLSMWMTPGIAVPVKIESVSGDKKVVYGLISWSKK